VPKNVLKKVSLLVIICLFLNVLNITSIAVVFASSNNIFNLSFENLSFSAYIDSERNIPANGSKLMDGESITPYRIYTQNCYENQIAYIGPSKSNIYGKTDQCLELTYNAVNGQTGMSQTDVFIQTVPELNLPINEGDIIRFSFEFAYSTSAKTMITCYLRGLVQGETELKNYRVKEIGDATDTWTEVSSGRIFSIREQHFNFPKYQYNEASKMGFAEGQWHKVDIVINTKDSNYENQQTLYLYLNGTLKKTYILDANANTSDVVEPFSKIMVSRLSSQLIMTQNSEDQTYSHAGASHYFDNIKIDIERTYIPPSFTFSGSAVEDCLEGEFLPGILNVYYVCDIFKIRDFGPSVNLICAQYKDNALISMEMISKTLTTTSNVIEGSFTTFSDSDKIKILAWNDELIPYADCVTLVNGLKKDTADFYEDFSGMGDKDIKRVRFESITEGIFAYEKTTGVMGKMYDNVSLKFTSEGVAEEGLNPYIKIKGTARKLSDGDIMHYGFQMALSDYLTNRNFQVYVYKEHFNQPVPLDSNSVISIGENGLISVLGYLVEDYAVYLNEWVDFDVVIDTGNQMLYVYVNGQLLHNHIIDSIIGIHSVSFEFVPLVAESSVTYIDDLFGKTLSENPQIGLNRIDSYVSATFDNLKANEVYNARNVSYVNYRPELGVFSYTPVYGAFGKSAVDCALLLSNNSDPFEIDGFIGEYEDIRYQAIDFTTGVNDIQDGDTVKLSFDFAVKSTKTAKYMAASAFVNSDGGYNIASPLYVDTDGTVRVFNRQLFIDNEPVRVMADKWYHIEIIIIPANRLLRTSNTFSVYWDGKSVIKDHPLVINGSGGYKFNGFSQLSFGYDISTIPLEGSAVLPDGNYAQYQEDGLYVDNFFYKVYRQASPPPVKTIMLSGPNPYFYHLLDNVKGVIYDYGQDKEGFVSRISSENVKKYEVIDATGNIMKGTSLANGYLRITTTDNQYIYYCVQSGSDPAFVDIPPDNFVYGDFGNPDMSGWYSYEQPDTDLIKGTALDVSFLLDAPAGKHGFLKVDGDKFVFEDGTEIQFWGCVVDDRTCFMTHEEAEKTAERIAAYGFNLVRIHKMDGWFFKPNIFGYADSGKTLDPEQMDKFFYFLNELRKRGIYYYIDLIVSRKVYDDDNLADPSVIDYGLKGPTYYNEDVINIQKQYAEMLLTYVSPYTGLSLVEDPAMVMVSLHNEFGFFNYDLESLASYYDELKQLFGQWLLKKYSTREALEAAWYQRWRTGLESWEDPAAGTVEIKNIGARGNYSDARRRDIILFQIDISKNYFKDRIEHLRNLGVKCPITGGTAWGNYQPASFYIHTFTDYIDTHLYWNHPAGNYYMEEGAYFNEYTDVVSQLETNYLGIIGKSSSQNIFGYPHVISEWNVCSGSPYVSEGPLLMAAYGRLQGWHPIAFRLSLTDNYHAQVKSGEKLTIKDFFSIIDHPIRSALFPSASAMFLRKDISEANTGYYSVLTDDDVSKPGSSYYPLPDNSRIGLIGKTGTAFESVKYDPNYNDDSVRQAAEEAGNNGTPFVSVTGELSTDLVNRIFTLNTPRSQGVCGFIGGKSIELGASKFEIDNKFATLTVVSLTDQPISTSDRILVTAAGDAKNSRQVLTPDGTRVLKTGTYPIMVEPITGNITLKVSGDYKVYVLTSSGVRKQEVPTEKTSEGHLTFTLTKEMQAMNYEVVKVH